MAMREIAVIGLGTFGRSVAMEYSRCGGNVMAVDINDEKVSDIADEVTYAVKADATDIDAMKKIGLGNVDAVVIAISDNLEAAIMATIAAKELGIAYIVCKSKSEIQATVLTKVGADEVILPEKDTGMRIAGSLLQGNFIDIADLSEDFCIIETKPLAEWVGKSLVELDIRGKYGLNVIAKKTSAGVSINMDSAEPLTEDMILVVLGENTTISKVFKR